MVRVNVDVLSPGLRSGNSSASISLEERANGEISVSTNIRWAMMASLSLWHQRSFRDLRMLSRDTMRLVLRPKPKPAPRGGVSSSMIILEPDDLEHGIVLSAAQAWDSDEYYAMLDSGTNAIILPLHPRMQGDIAECQVPSATVTGPIVQTYEFNGAKRLVVALPQSTILVSLADHYCRMGIHLRTKARIRK